MQAKHGAYYFFAPAPTRNPWTGKIQTWIRLCSIADGEPERYSKLGERIGNRKLVDGTMPSLCEAWKDRKLGRYSDEVQKEYKRMADAMAAAFEDYTVAQVTTKDCADFLRDDFKSKHNTAQKYANVLRKMFRFAISERGFGQDNPCDQLDLSDYQTKRREVLPAHDAIKAIRDAALIGKDGLPTESGPMSSASSTCRTSCGNARSTCARSLKHGSASRQSGSNRRRRRPGAARCWTSRSPHRSGP
ncbi:hypothetical protein [Paraburkholderia caballeronis]|uniref:hypothetical protein n=1 Tax=Paraburkholderia caballeronis TaxID=416943 RepID=UPI00115F85AB|nr:hypothetical protein [Paraburkholderia caballeronis]